MNRNSGLPDHQASTQISGLTTSMLDGYALLSKIHCFVFFSFTFPPSSLGVLCICDFSRCRHFYVSKAIEEPWPEGD